MMSEEDEEVAGLQEAEYDALTTTFDAEELSIKQDDARRYRGVFTAFMAPPNDRPHRVIGPMMPVKSDDFEEKADAEKRQSVSIDYFPPVTVHFAMPAGYPMTCRPNFDLRASWLPSASVQRLREELSRVCEENEGGFMLFAMFQFLQQEAGDCLDIPDDTLDLFAIASVSKVRGGLFLFIIECNNDQKERTFRRQLHECQLCASEKMGDKFVRFKDCGHFFCIECTRRGFQVHVQEGAVDQVKCFECNVRPPQHQLRALLSEESFERYERLMLSRGLDSMSDVMECPRCSTPVLLDLDESLGVCSSCNFAFCMHCSKTYHGVNPCQLKDLSRILNSYSKGSSKEKQELEKRYGKRNLEKLIENVKNEEYLSNSKRCPSCSSPLEKIEGCNKMTCFKCGAFFCWLCEKLIKEKNPYVHFSRGECANRLFEGIAWHPFEDGFGPDDGDDSDIDEDLGLL